MAAAIVRAVFLADGGGAAIAVVEDGVPETGWQ